jgi:hypothetical protein
MQCTSIGLYEMIDYCDQLFFFADYVGRLL